MLVEVCCGNRESAVNAGKAGAKRIELCRELSLGGLTPSHEDILFCKTHLKLQTFVLIRPRGGDFCYNEEEFGEIHRAVKSISGRMNEVLFANREQERKNEGKGER